MKYPLDTSDEASLIQADWYEEFGDIEVANQIREEVTDPKVNNWHSESFGVRVNSHGGVGVGFVGGDVGGVVGGGVGVGVGGGVFGVGGSESTVGVFSFGGCEGVGALE